MSSVPPNIAGSVLQSNMAQRQVGRVRSNEDIQRNGATRQQTNAIDANDTTVGTDDEDTQVHTDAEGTGSQGRNFNNPEETEEQENTDSQSPSGDEGQHIDLQA